MKIRAWRLVQARYAANAFSGEGASLYGGRWNSVGARAVYASGSLSLAVLEILAGGLPIGLLESYVKIPVDFDDTSVSCPATLPEEWNVYPAFSASRRIGDKWIKERRSAVLQVPSAIVPEEFNYLLNPLHSDFKTAVAIRKAGPFAVDPRLVEGGA
jgi:RES domain-containing protein